MSGEMDTTVVCLSDLMNGDSCWDEDKTSIGQIKAILIEAMERSSEYFNIHVLFILAYCNSGMDNSVFQNVTIEE